MKTSLFLTALCLHSLTFSQSTSNYQTYKIHFAFGESTISNDEIQKWKTFEEKMPSNYQITELKAHTDTVSSYRFNMNLAEKRLNAVKSFLQPTNKIVETVVGEKEAQLSTNYSDEGFRIVEVRYILTPKISDEPIKKEEKTALTKTVESFLTTNSKENQEFDLSVLFEPGLPVILPSSYPELNELLEIMTENPNLNIVIHGHVCCSSEPSLAKNRAGAVFLYLQSNNVSRNRMKIIGHDNKRPKVWPERTEADRIANRRVSIEFMKQ